MSDIEHKSLTIRINGDTEGLVSAFKRARRQVKKLNRELRESKRLLRSIPSSPESRS